MEELSALARFQFKIQILPKPRTTHNTLPFCKALLQQPQIQSHDQLTTLLHCDIMPSRKKAQGKARKEKQRSNPLNNDADSQACVHYDRQHTKDWSRDEVDAALKLANEYLYKCNRISLSANNDIKQALGDLKQLQHEAYNEYCQFNDNGKKLFKTMLVSDGTGACIAAAKQTDLSKNSSVRGTWPYINMILTIEVRDRYDEVMNDNVAGEVRKCLDDITHCPRVTVRFFTDETPVVVSKNCTTS